MPQKTGFADVIRDWEGLLGAVDDNKEALPNVEPHRVALAQHLVETKALKGRQDSARALRQQATQDLKAMLDKGRGLAIRLRGAVRGDLGHKAERLVQFGVVPFRKHPRRPKGEDGEPETPQPPGPVSPSPAKEEVKPAQ
jgi:hypothetical protein